MKCLPITSTQKMADELTGEEDEVLELDLDVSFNEFAEEFPQNDIILKSEQSKDTNSENVCSFASGFAPESQMSMSDGEVDSETGSGKNHQNKSTESFKRSASDRKSDLNCSYLSELSGRPKAKHENLNWNNNSTESETEMSNGTADRLGVRDLREKISGSRVNGKRRASSPVEDSDLAGEAHSSIALSADNFDMERWRQAKKQRVEHMEVDQEPEEMPRKKRGGVKKKKKRKDHSERKYIVPRIRNLFKPLNVGVDDPPHVVAREVSYRLNEEKTWLIRRCVNCIGCEKALELFNETKKVQQGGGMRTQVGDRRRTNGGVFLTLLKSGGYATKEQIKEIFAEERAMQVAKEREKNSRRAREARQQQQQQQNNSELGTGEES